MAPPPKPPPKTTQIPIYGEEAETGECPGLVLLFNEDFQRLPGAWMFGADRIVLGSDAGSNVHLPSSGVSRAHAEFTRAAAGWLVRDLGSTNRTVLNGEAVQEAVVEPGAELQFGSVITKFVDQHADLYTAYRIDGVLLHGAHRQCRSGTALIGGWQIDCVAAQIEKFAPSPLGVMILGESGTGKEVAAREIHRLSGRRGNFAAVNCAAIPANLVESELFGYKRGAFTGAARDKPGLIQAANGGTLLLDEIGDMPPEAQAKLLRVLETQEVYPLGATSPEKVNVRVVSATHRDLSALQASGEFRPDLFARLGGFKITLPPLRQRKEDLYALLRAFLAAEGRPELRPSLQFMMEALRYHWPYNVREFLACAKRCAALCAGPELLPSHLPEEVRAASGKTSDSRNPPAPRAEPEDTPPQPKPSAEALRSLLVEHRGNVAAVGRVLGKARQQIHRWMQQYGINVNDYR
jgi:transcriptional regulator of acetoin/glycerol metabolism